MFTHVTPLFLTVSLSTSQLYLFVLHRYLVGTNDLKKIYFFRSVVRDTFKCGLVKTTIKIFGTRVWYQGTWMLWSHNIQLLFIGWTVVALHQNICTLVIMLSFIVSSLEPFWQEFEGFSKKKTCIPAMCHIHYFLTHRNQTKMTIYLYKIKN